VPGTLFVVSTPIGNLGDWSDRAREVLGGVAIVACEDTRVTGKLLRRFEIRTPLRSYHEHNEVARAGELLSLLLEGRDVALVSDAGTPLVSDPGYRLVRAAREAGVEIRAVPGPSALLAALAVSGLPSSRFTFVGFLPPKGAARARAIGSLERIEHTLVFFEAGTRVERTLKDLATALGSRPAVLLREMTKLHEEHRSGSLAELHAWTSDQKLRGEMTLVVSGPGDEEKGRRVEGASLAALAPRFQELRDSGLSAREAAKRLGREVGVPSRTLYNELVRERDGEEA
jgi:16S rRNA (cytidine1402-2'-O)-methyltransferase